MDTPDTQPNQGTPTPAAPQTPPPQQNTPGGDNTTLMAVLAYIGPLVIIPFLVAKDQPFVKYHIRQGAVLFALEVLMWVLGSMFIVWVFAPLIMLVNLGLLVLSIVGIVNVLQKKEVPLPIVGSLSEYVKI